MQKTESAWSSREPTGPRGGPMFRLSLKDKADTAVSKKKKGKIPSEVVLRTVADGYRSRETNLYTVEVEEGEPKGPGD